MKNSNGINIYNEGLLHAALKTFISQPADEIEVNVDGYIIDIRRQNLLIEIQTRNFAAIKKKLYTLVESHPVRLIYPITKRKWIVKIPHKDAPVIAVPRRKSPRQGSTYDLFTELVHLPKLVNHENFVIEVLYIFEEEYRRWVGRKAWRRKGWAVDHRRLIEVVSTQVYESAHDFIAILPSQLPSEFTTNDLALHCDCTQRLAGRMAYTLREMGAIQYIGKKGRSFLYSVAS
jgi:hypothetical protein